MEYKKNLENHLNKLYEKAQPYLNTKQGWSNTPNIFRLTAFNYELYKLQTIQSIKPTTEFGELDYKIQEQALRARVEAAEQSLSLAAKSVVADVGAVKLFKIGGVVIQVPYFNPIAEHVEEGYYYFPFLINSDNEVLYILLYSYGTNTIQNWAYNQVKKQYIGKCNFYYGYSDVFIFSLAAREVTNA